MSFSKGAGIRFKILGGFFVLILLIGIVTATGFLNILNVNKQIQEIKKQELNMIDYQSLAFSMVRANSAIRGYMLTGQPRMLDTYKTIGSQVPETVNKIRESGVKSANLDKFNQLSKEWFQGIDQQILPAVEQGDKERALVLSGPILGDKSTELVLLAQNMAKEKENEIKKIQSEIISNGQKVLWVMIGVGIGSLVIGAVLGFVIGNRIVRSLLQVVQSVETVAAGDFRTHVDVQSGDELGRLADTVNAMVKKLRDIILQVKDNSANLAANSEELSSVVSEVGNSVQHIAAMSEQIASGAERTTSRIDQMTEGIGNLTRFSQETSNSAKEAVQNVGRISASAKHGQDVLNTAVEKMDSISQTTRESSRVINELQQQMGRVGEILHIITNISEQTGLLSLNAAIEAARAGEQGRGFAVVASEVRKLAEQSQQSVKEIENLLNGIKEKTEQAVHAMETGASEVENGVQAISDTGKSLEQIFIEITHTVAFIEQIAAGASEQAETIKVFSSNIEDVAHVSGENSSASQNAAAATEQSLASMEEILKASEELAHMAENLSHMVESFRV